MSEYIITEKENIVAVADTVRSKAGITGELNFDEMIDGINSIGGAINLQDKTVDIASNGSQTVSADGGYHGLSNVVINVAVPPEEPILQNKTVNVTQNGTQTVSADGQYDGLGTVTINANVASSGGVPSSIVAGDTPVLVSSTMAYTCTATNMTNTGISITIPRTGTYRFMFSCGRTSTSGTWTAQLYKNNSAVSGATATWSQYQGTYNGTVSCNAGDTITIYARSRGSTYRAIIGQLVACIDWDTGF